MRQLSDLEMDEVRDGLIDAINIIEARPSQNFSNDMEREQALESWSWWARDFVRGTHSHHRIEART